MSVSFHVDSAKGTLQLTLVVTLLISLFVVAAGCALVYLGATGHTDLELFGAKVSTASVGVVGIVCGTVIGIVNTRRLIGAIERLAELSATKKTGRSQTARNGSVAIDSGRDTNIGQHDTATKRK